MIKKIKEIIADYIDDVSNIRCYHGAQYAVIPLLIPLFLLFFLVLLLCSDWDSRVLWVQNAINTNEVVVETAGLSPNDHVAVKWTCDCYCDTIVVFEDGESKNLKFKKSGNNIFLVYVNDSLICEKVQYKKVFWEGYDYKFVLNKAAEKYKIDLIVED
jgi:hypothetical protein